MSLTHQPRAPDSTSRTAFRPTCHRPRGARCSRPRGSTPRRVEHGNAAALHVEAAEHGVAVVRVDDARCRTASIVNVADVQEPRGRVVREARDLKPDGARAEDVSGAVDVSDDAELIAGVVGVGGVVVGQTDQPREVAPGTADLLAGDDLRHRIDLDEALGGRTDFVGDVGLPDHPGSRVVGAVAQPDAGRCRSSRRSVCHPAGTGTRDRRR